MTTLLDDLGELLRYPGSDYLSRLDQACEESSRDDEFRALLQKFRTHVAALSLQDLQELYTRTFDHSLAERGELPDHLANLLPLLGRMPAQQAEELREAGALPALRKMMQPFSGNNLNPYGDLLRSILSLLQAPIGTPSEEVRHV